MADKSNFLVTEQMFDSFKSSIKKDIDDEITEVDGKIENIASFDETTGKTTKLKVGDSELTEANLIALLALIQNE